MDIHNTAAAHLPQFAVAVKLEPETGLRPRPPTILEAQSVDKHLWSVVSDLVQEKSWSLDQALHELTYVRSDMSTWLQARPRLPKPSPPLKGGKGDRVPYQPWEPSGKIGKKGKSPKGGKGKGGTKWVTEALVDDKRHQLCMRYQTNQCTFADCKYLHACAMPTSEGAQKHPAMQRRNTEYTSLTRYEGGHLRTLNRCESSVAWIYSFRFTISANGSTIIAASCITILSVRNSDFKQYSTRSGCIISSRGGHDRLDCAWFCGINSSGGGHDSFSDIFSFIECIKRTSSTPKNFPGCLLGLISTIIYRGATQRWGHLVHWYTHPWLHGPFGWQFFLQLLKLCASGVIAYGAFAPSCCEYSRLDLKPGGPKPLRHRDHLDSTILLLTKPSVYRKAM